MARFNMLHGYAEDKLDGLPAEFFQACVTSPPYWQLRDYLGNATLGGESTPEEYVEKLVCIMRGVRRCLKKDGLLFLNLGDTYCGGGGYSPNSPSNLARSKQSTNRGARPSKRPVPSGYKKKDLVGVPWMAALALRKDGWWLRNDIIWSKPNGMPEKLNDRLTKTHEYIFMLSKSPKYKFNKGAAKENGVGGVRHMRAVWSIATKASSDTHFTVFPEELPERCLSLSVGEGDWVLDPFCGSGTTGVVALRMGCNFVGVEPESEYCLHARQVLLGCGGSECQVSGISP